MSSLDTHKLDLILVFIHQLLLDGKEASTGKPDHISEHVHAKVRWRPVGVRERPVGVRGRPVGVRRDLWEFCMLEP